MREIYVATKTRGFLIDLFNSDFKTLKYVYESNKVYETNSRSKLVISRLVKTRIADHLGIIQRVKAKENNVAFSYNRFLKSNKDYIIYLENPLALVHYSTRRTSARLSKVKLKKYLNDINLKSIICLSKACYQTINNFYEIPTRVKVEQIYPLVNRNPFTNLNTIKSKCKNPEINCLYVSSNFKLKGGREILAAFENFKQINLNNIKLKIITKIDSVDEDTQKKIYNNSNINMLDFKLSKEELNKVYNDSNILLNPTRQDSFSLVVLEALKSGNVVLTTDLYAIPEMVVNGYNGYLISPKHRFFNYDNMPNETVWNNRKRTIYSNYIDNNIVDFITTKLKDLYLDRKKLYQLSLNAYECSNAGEFNVDYIKGKWESAFDAL